MTCICAHVCLPDQERDLRLDIFRNNLEMVCSAEIVAEADGIVSGIEYATELSANLKISFQSIKRSGAGIKKGEQICLLTGNPVVLLKAEEMILGALSKSSGIASAAYLARKAAAGHFRIVCGATKKMPHCLKTIIRKAICDGGIDMRMAHQPFVYLDKNYVRIFGSLKKTLDAVTTLGRPIVIQVRGETGSIAEEAVFVAKRGAGTVMVDTGKISDLDLVSTALKKANLRDRVNLAFAGNLKLNDLSSLIEKDIDAIDIGYDIVDAPCLPMRFDVQTGYEET